MRNLKTCFKISVGFTYAFGFSSRADPWRIKGEIFFKKTSFRVGQFLGPFGVQQNTKLLLNFFLNPISVHWTFHLWIYIFCSCCCKLIFFNFIFLLPTSCGCVLFVMLFLFRRLLIVFALFPCLLCLANGLFSFYLMSSPVFYLCFALFRPCLFNRFKALLRFGRKQNY